MSTYWSTLWNALRGKHHETEYMYPSEIRIKLDDKAIAEAANRGAMGVNDEMEDDK